jgi:truncated hemoglobin YjbI
MECAIGNIPAAFLKRATDDPILSKYFSKMCRQGYVAMMTRIIRDIMDYAPVDMREICRIHENVAVTHEECRAWLECFRKSCEDLAVPSEAIAKRLEPILSAMRTRDPPPGATMHALIDRVVDTYAKGNDVIQDLLRLQELIHQKT